MKTEEDSRKLFIAFIKLIEQALIDQFHHFCYGKSC